MALLFLQHVARGALGTPTLPSAVDMGGPASICHVSPGRRVKRVSHDESLEALPSVIQAQVCLGSPVRMEEVQPG